MDLIAEIRNEIAHEMVLFEAALSAELSSDNLFMRGVGEYVQQKNNSHFVAMLTILTSKLFSTTNSDTIHSALAIELLYTASRIHQDVLSDGGIEQESSSERWGNKIAVLGGDYLLSLALKIGMHTKSMSVLNSISAVGLSLSDGELIRVKGLDLHCDLYHLYWTSVAKRIEAVFETAVRFGLGSSVVDEAKIQPVLEFAKDLACCSQMSEDLRTYSKMLPEKDLGFNLLVFTAIQNLSKEDKMELKQYIDSDFANSLRPSFYETLFENAQAIAEIKTLIAQRKEQAHANLQKMNVSDSMRNVFHFMLTYACAHA